MGRTSYSCGRRAREDQWPTLSAIKGAGEKETGLPNESKRSDLVQGDRWSAMATREHAKVALEAINPAPIFLEAYRSERPPRGLHTSTSAHRRNFSGPRCREGLHRGRVMSDPRRRQLRERQHDGRGVCGEALVTQGSEAVLHWSQRR
jgi:hypothetical protein